MQLNKKERETAKEDLLRLSSKQRAVGQLQNQYHQQIYYQVRKQQAQ